jgi:hypothetical protein
MNTKILFLALMVATSFIGCNKETHDNLVYNLNEPDTLTSDDYEIYNLIANPFIPKREIIFIYQATQLVDIDTIGLKEVDGVDVLLIQDYYSKIDYNIYLNEDSFSFENKVILVPENISDRNVFDEIYNSPKVRDLSIIAYNDNFTKAIVGASDRADWGWIYYTYYLKKEDNKWLKIWNSEYAIGYVK